MIVECKEHGSAYIQVIPAGFSKTKNKPYKAFTVCDYDKGKPTKCKFTGPAPDEETDPEQEYEEFTRDLEAEQKHEAQQKLDEIDDDEGPMKKSDWALKDKRITRLTIAKSYIQAGIDHASAMKDGDADEWFEWVWKK